MVMLPCVVQSADGNVTMRGSIVLVDTAHNKVTMVLVGVESTLYAVTLPLV
jgi:hypothetical protein